MWYLDLPLNSPENEGGEERKDQKYMTTIGTILGLLTLIMSKC